MNFSTLGNSSFKYSCVSSRHQRQATPPKTAEQLEACPANPIFEGSNLSHNQHRDRKHPRKQPNSWKPVQPDGFLMAGKQPKTVSFPAVLAVFQPNFQPFPAISSRFGCFPADLAVFQPKTVSFPAITIFPDFCPLFSLKNCGIPQLSPEKYVNSLKNKTIQLDFSCFFNPSKINRSQSFNMTSMLKNRKSNKLCELSKFF